MAKVFDSRGASDTETKSGRTYNRVERPSGTNGGRDSTSGSDALENLKVSTGLLGQSLFISALIPNDCVSPGEETFLYASMKNRDDKGIDDVKITAAVPELGIRAVSGPFDVRKGGTPSRHLYFAVPSDAKDGEYPIRITISSDHESIVKYRSFEVSDSCRM